MNSLLSHHRKFDIFMLHESKHITKSALSACVFIMSLPKILTTNLEKVRRPRQILLIHARPENMTEWMNMWGRLFYCAPNCNFSLLSFKNERLFEKGLGSLDVHQWLLNTQSFTSAVDNSKLSINHDIKVRKKTMNVYPAYDNIHLLFSFMYLHFYERKRTSVYMLNWPFIIQ